MKFLIKGKIKKGNEFKKFSKEIDATNENVASERIYSFFGSNYRCKRHLVKIEKIEELK